MTEHNEEMRHWIKMGQSPRTSQVLELADKDMEVITTLLYILEG